MKMTSLSLKMLQSQRRVGNNHGNRPTNQNSTYDRTAYSGRGRKTGGDVSADMAKIRIRQTLARRKCTRQDCVRNRYSSRRPVLKFQQVVSAMRSIVLGSVDFVVLSSVVKELGCIPSRFANSRFCIPRLKAFSRHFLHSAQYP